MVILYTWVPIPPLDAIERHILPDLGHSALAVVQEDQEIAYVSYWPECDSLINQATSLWKPRTIRHPSSYAEETDPMGPFMQRVADYQDEIEGLQEQRIVNEWSRLQDTAYDFLHWNCSNICKYLLIRAMDSEDYNRIREADHLTPNELTHITGPEDILEIFRFVATAHLIDCRPDDIRRMMRAYLALRASSVVGDPPEKQ